MPEEKQIVQDVKHEGFHDMIEANEEINLLLYQFEVNNFKADELTRGHVVPKALRENIIPTIVILQNIREYLGAPVMINSGYRPEDYNRKVGGKPNSLHLKFNAIDFFPIGPFKDRLQDLVDDIADNKFAAQIYWNDKLTTITPEVMGIGLYDTFIHLDTRGLLGMKAPARWRG